MQADGSEGPRMLEPGRSGPGGARPAAGLEALKPRCAAPPGLTSRFFCVLSFFGGFVPCGGHLEKVVRCSVAPSPHTARKRAFAFGSEGYACAATADPSAAGPTSTHQLTLLRTTWRSRGPTMAAEMDAPALNGGVNGVSEV